MSDHAVEFRPLSALHRAPRNPQGHDLGALHQSFERFGYVEPIIVSQASGRIVSGHGRLDALEQRRKQGLPPPEGIQVRDGEWLVPIIERPFLNSAEEEAYLIAANRLVTLGGQDDSTLAAMLADLAAGPGLPGTGFDNDDLDTLLRDLKGDGAAADEIPPHQGGDTTAKLGDLWRLGPHALLCADSANPENLQRALQAAGGALADAMITDPPYAIYGSSTGIGSDITDDKIVRPFSDRLLQNASACLPWFGHAYVCCDWRTWPAIWEAAKPHRMAAKNLIVWDKGGGGLGANYANTYELVGFFAKIPQAVTMTSGAPSGQRPVHRPNLIHLNRVPHKDRQHNAAKPVELFEEFTRNSTDHGGLILDPFAGSGTAIVAAERLGRRCAALEIEPRYVDIIVKRWETLTGKQATREPQA